MTYRSWVKCNCPNSFILPGIKEVASLINSQGTPSDMYNRYTCGHRNGVMHEVWPGDLFEISKSLKVLYNNQLSPFPIFSKITDFHLYTDRLLHLGVAEASQWKDEIIRILQMMHSSTYNDEVSRIMQATFGVSLETAWRAIADQKWHRVQNALLTVVKEPNNLPFPYKDADRWYSEGEPNSELSAEQEELFRRIHAPFISAETTYHHLFKQYLDSVIMYLDVDTQLFYALNLCQASEITSNPILIEK